MNGQGFNTFFGRNRRPLENPPVTFIRDEFTVYDVGRALAFYHQDYGGVPADMLDAKACPGGRMSRTQEELYADLVEARAEDLIEVKRARENNREPGAMRFLPMLKAMADFMDEGE